MNGEDRLERPPSVDRILTSDTGLSLISRFGRQAVTSSVQTHVEEIRRDYPDNRNQLPPLKDLMQQIEQSLVQSDQFSLTRVFNLTGTILHTNLGRALLPESAVSRIIEVATSPSNLEFDLESGKRGDRDTHIESLLCELTGAEAATVVNNNAAAVMLVLNTLALDRQVPVSRGELVEIGGSFRIPEIMARSGCRLVEVGATNRTHLKDYREAINETTAMLMKVHTSNYRIEGFTSSVPEKEVADLAHEHGLLYVTDLGSGNLLDFAEHGLPREPTVREALDDGADLVTFSGDKLLGGPQAGLIVGNRAQVDAVKRNPMKRALRVDKMTLAGLYEVLRLYRDPDRLLQELPTIRHLTRSIDEISTNATILLESFTRALEHRARVSVVSTQCQIGSGALPLTTLPSQAICIRTLDGSDDSLTSLAVEFRRLSVPLIGRINDGSLLFDLRTVDRAADIETELAGLQGQVT